MLFFYYFIFLKLLSSTYVYVHIFKKQLNRMFARKYSSHSLSARISMDMSKRLNEKKIEQRVAMINVKVFVFLNSGVARPEETRRTATRNHNTKCGFSLFIYIYSNVSFVFVQ